jgi:hypothetical protein
LMQCPVADLDPCPLLIPGGLEQPAEHGAQLQGEARNKWTMIGARPDHAWPEQAACVSMAHTGGNQRHRDTWSLNPGCWIGYKHGPRLPRCVHMGHRRQHVQVAPDCPRSSGGTLGEPRPAAAGHRPSWAVRRASPAGPPAGPTRPRASACLDGPCKGRSLTRHAARHSHGIRGSGPCEPSSLQASAHCNRSPPAKLRAPVHCPLRRVGLQSPNQGCDTSALQARQPL